MLIQLIVERHHMLFDGEECSIAQTYVYSVSEGYEFQIYKMTF